jgi:hypothetical protein
MLHNNNDNFIKFSAEIINKFSIFRKKIEKKLIYAEIRIKRTIVPGCFQNLKEPPSFMKELMVFSAVTGHFQKKKARNLDKH